MTKDKLLKLLLDHKGEILSGPDLSKKLGVSRNSVWKAINALRKENHKIISVKNKGYFLEVHSDGLSHHEILKNLGSAGDEYHILILDEIPSTNTYLKDHEELLHNTIVLAKVQSQGRGRRGKSFYSMDEGGIYMSLLKKKNLKDYDIELVTIASALALSEVTDETLGTNSQVKWVNDLFVSGKKIAGILTEGTMELETRTLTSLIIGVGININTKAFPKELEEIATSFFLESNEFKERNAIIAKIILTLEKYLLMTKTNPQILIDQYRSKMLYLGEEIQVHQGNNHYSGILKDLSENGHLIILRDGQLHELSSGEISIRKSEDTL